MDELPAAAFAIEADGMSVKVLRELKIAALRYFDSAGSFAAAARATVGPLPEPLRALCATTPAGSEQIILAWRSPTETLLMTNDGSALAGLERRLAGMLDGCMVDQTGGVRVLEVKGPRAEELLLRLGADTAIPGLGEARSSRLAELQVLAACVAAQVFLLCVERVYADHLLGWMSATAADF